MKKTWLKFSVFAIAISLLAPASLLAQKDDKGDKGDKEKKDVRQIIVTARGEKDEKITVEINGDKITVNGKPLEDYKGKDGDISVRISKLKDLEFLARVPGAGTNWNLNSFNDFKVFTDGVNHAMLGVTTEKTDEGAKINGITKESAAEKIGLKEGDVITKIDDAKIEDPDDLSAAIKTYKPGDKVVVTYLRDKKEQKASVELTKWKGTTGVYNLKMDPMDLNLNFDRSAPRVPGVPNMKVLPDAQNWSWSGNGPKLGLSVQDTDDGKGVKVIDVDDESNAAKAGIKEDDIVTEADGKAINSTDDMVKVIRESKDKASIMIKLQRAGKTQNIEVKMPRKIKTADL